MTSWYSSWLPGLPSIDFALPSSIQRRFISFALKKSLGHLLRPGQLDVHQIDSQIGSGYVQVKDLELDNQAINSILTGLPIKLHDGSISSVTARIPWPNPLTSTLGFSIQSLHLTFHLTPVTPEPVAFSTANLADSVVSVAESFMHDELTPREEATLRESFHPDLASSLHDHAHIIPGSMDPFLRVGTDEEFHSDMDPAGVSIFATLIERLLARFEFDAIDTKITLIHPEHASFTLSIAEIRYGTETGADGSGSDRSERDKPGDEGLKQTSGETRKASISGFVVSVRDLHPLVLPSPMSLTPSTASPVSPNLWSRPHTGMSSSRPLSSASSTSSSSSLDEDTQMLMSQSLAYLPPRAVPVTQSPSSSMASSMFQSAVTTVSQSKCAPDHGSSQISAFDDDHRCPSDSDTIENDQEDHISESNYGRKEETILSFGGEPILIRLITPPVSLSADHPVEGSPTSPHLASPSIHPPLRGNDKPVSEQKVMLTFSAGVLACGFRAWHIRSVLDILDAWGTHHAPVVSASTSASSSTSNPTDTIFGLGVDISMKMRGIVILLLPPETFEERHIASSPTVLDTFFTRPLIPPRLVHGCVRVFLDSITLSCSISNSLILPVSAAAKAQPPQATRNSTTSTTSPLTIVFSLNDISAFVLFANPQSTSQHNEVSAAPILITDNNLPTQYTSTHIHPDPHAIFAEGYDYPQLTDFGILDWTAEKYRTNSTKLSTWRTKIRPKVSKRPESQTGVGAGVPPSPSKSNSIPQVASGLDTQVEQTYHPPAIVVNAKISLVSSAKEQAGGPELDNRVEVEVVPLHIYVDLGLALGGDALNFLSEVVGDDAEPVESRHEDDENDSSDEGVGSIMLPSSSRKPSIAKYESERQRLERSVLEDLNLELDYRDEQFRGAPRKSRSSVSHGQGTGKSRRSRTKRGLNIAVNLNMIRLEVRCPPPPLRAARSGAVILDLHGIKLSAGTQLERKPMTRFSNVDPSAPLFEAQGPLGRHPLLAAECQRLVIAISPLGQQRANIVLSLGALSSMGEVMHEISSVRTSASPSATLHPARPLPIHILISRSQPATSSSRTSETSTVAVTIDISSVHADISKPLLDGLQLWADDISQLVERTSGTPAGDTDTEKAESRNPSLIGSRFFAKTRRYGSKSSEESGGGTSISNRTEVENETVIKVVLSEVFIRLEIPRDQDQSLSVRPFDIFASNVDILTELKPEGKDETVITLGVMDLNINDSSSTGLPTSFLCLTAQRNMSTTPKSLVKLRFTSLMVPETTAKESRVKLTLCGFTYNIYPDLKWTADLGRFFKAPPGVFESVIPSERTRIAVKVMDGSIRASAPNHPGAAVLHVGELEFATNIVGDSPEMSFHLSIPSISLFLVDNLTGLDESAAMTQPRSHSASGGIAHWQGLGYALLAEIVDLDLRFKRSNTLDLSDSMIIINHAKLRMHLCADTLQALTAFITDVMSIFKPPVDTSIPKPKRMPTNVSTQAPKSGIMSSIDEDIFRKIPEVGTAPDMVNDDLPSNLDYLDASFGTAAGLRELRDDDLDEFDPADAGRVTPTQSALQLGVISNVGGETIKVFRPFNIVENYFDTLQPDPSGGDSDLGETTLKIHVHDCDITVLLYDGYDWARTRKAIEEEVKEMRRRLTKIRQLVANGQTQDPSVEETSTLLFNSVYIGLDQDVDELEPGALIAAIDEELNDDADNESQSSWQSLRPPSTGKPRVRSARVHGKRLTRSRGPSIEFKLSGLSAEIDQYRPGEALVSRTFVTVRDLEILDHIKTSTWQKFLTELRSDSRGNVRETDSNMVRVELRTVRPVPKHPSEEARLRAKILPLRLYVDQDALDFLKKFFSFQDPDSVATPSTDSSDGEIYFQHAEVFPVDIKLDYKPRRVDYRALREGKTIELMNFFHFDGSEMTLRHITLSGITGWPRFFDMLNDLWTPDVKATQLVDVISGVSPIRSVVNVGSGVADLVLLPIAQYKKDGRIVRGVQKGTTAFVKSTAMEAIKLGARLATGTQVILEQAENVLGGQFKDSITAETLQVSPLAEEFMGHDVGSSEDEPTDSISKYAEQPADVKEGVQSAYKSLQKNFNSAAQTILAVPMEVYERSGTEGPVRAVIRAVPIAVLKPMIGASEAVSKTLMGLHNTMDPNIRHENEDKYKHR